MTEAQPLAQQIQWNSSSYYANQFADLGRTNNVNCDVILYEHWGSNSSSWAAWRTAITQDLPAWQGIVSAVSGCRLLPGGQAIAALYDNIQSGSVPGYSSIAQFFTDDIHLNAQGNYFMSLVQYATIYRRTPVGATSTTYDRWASPYATVSASAVSTLQEIAWGVVQQFI
jgi:hypothetical protein